MRLALALTTLVIIVLAATLASLPKTPDPECSLGGGINRMTEAERFAVCGW